MKAKIITALLIIVIIMQSTAISIVAINVDDTLELGNNISEQDEHEFNEITDNSTNIEMEITEIENEVGETQNEIIPEDTMSENPPEYIIEIEKQNNAYDDMFENNEEENVVARTSEKAETALEEQINLSDVVILENEILEDEKITVKKTVSEGAIINRENIIENDFFGNIIVEIESGDVAETDSITGNFDVNYMNNNEPMTIDESVYSTAPVIDNFTSLRTNPTEGMRFTATVSPEQRNAALEYGFLVANTNALEDNNIELTFDVTEITFLSGIGYSITENIDKVFYIDENGNYVYSMVLLNIPETAYVKDVTARPYIIYNIDGVETIVYGDTYSNNAYRTAKTELVDSNDDAVLEYAQTIIDSVENSSLYLESAAVVSLGESVDGCVGEKPDIDVVSFIPEESRFYTITFTSGLPCEYEVLDEFGDTFTFVKTGNNPTNVAYLFEKNEIYYVRIKGAPETEYSFWFTPCMEGALIYDFADGTEGFTCGDGATGTAEDGKLKVSIDKSISLTKAFMENDNLSIDLFDYSRLIIRMKNTTNTTTLSGTVRIDLEYDGGGINYSLDSAMPANMTSFENVEFDFTTRYGNVSLLKLSFGQILSSLSGDIYIDSIAILPMPEVLAWEFNETNEGWSDNDQVDSAVIEDGALVLDLLGSVTGMAPAINSPGTSAYDFDKYNKITIALKNETNSTNMQVYFSTLAEGLTSFSENKKFTVEIEPSSNEFVEYSMYLTDHELFTDSLKDIMISIPAEGIVSIDYIRLSKHVAVYDNVVWDFEDNDLEGFYSNNERHTLSIDNGAMIVETQETNWGAFFTPAELNLPTSEYRYLVVGINSSSAPSDFQVYFTTSTMNPAPGLNYHYAETDHNNKVVYKHTLQIEKSDTFREYVIDLPYAQEEYTSGYTGNLKQLMLALTQPGTFEIDYIMLTAGNDNEEIVINATEDSEYKIVITKNNNHTIGTYTIKYDADVFELADACVFTHPLETNVGQIVGTDMSIASVSDGFVSFTVSNKTAAGVINCLEFKALKNAESTISVTTSIE